jgi:hypothetical protein
MDPSNFCGDISFLITFFKICKKLCPQLSARETVPVKVKIKIISTIGTDKKKKCIPGLGVWLKQ